MRVKGKESPASGVENEPLLPSDRNKLGKGESSLLHCEGVLWGEWLITSEWNTCPPLCVSNKLRVRETFTHTGEVLDERTGTAAHLSADAPLYTDKLDVDWGCSALKSKFFILYIEALFGLPSCRFSRQRLWEIPEVNCIQAIFLAFVLQVFWHVTEQSAQIQVFLVQLWTAVCSVIWLF